MDGVEGDNRAPLQTHHALVDGISGVDIISVLFDTSPDPVAPTDPGDRWLPRPMPSGAQLLGEALVERGTIPAEVARSVRAVFRGPRGSCPAPATPPSASERWPGRASNPAPTSPYNQSIGPHRRFTLGACRPERDQGDQERGSAGRSTTSCCPRWPAPSASICAGAGQNTDELELKAMIPVSVRADVERGALGNRVAAMMAPLPVWCQDPVARLDLVREEPRASSRAARPWAPRCSPS